MHFFDISTSKSGPHLVCFVHFDFEMCFAPQRHALFDIATSKRGPNMVCFVHFDFEIISRHNGVQFFISHLASWLRTRRFSEPSGAPNHWKNTVFRDFPTVSRICIFFLLIFSLLTLFTSAFQLSILSEVSLLNFLRLRKIISADPCCGGERVREATFVKQFEKTCWVTVVSCFKLFSVHPKRRQALVKGMECNGTGPRHRCDQPPVFLFGSEGTVRHWLHLETGPVRPSLVGGLSAAALVEDSLGTSPRALGNFFFVRFRR